MKSMAVIAKDLTDRDPSVRCSSCERYVTGRVYDLHVAIWDETGETARTHGAITLCGACRSDFDGADFALDADDMWRRSTFGCQERVCFCHDESAEKPEGFSCSHCGCHAA
jgi:hypothetical protein